jgi:NAD/NADP transhydrogenase beta subunit
MLDNPLLLTVGSLIGVSGSILSYVMVRSFHFAFVIAPSQQRGGPHLLSICAWSGTRQY